MRASVQSKADTCARCRETVARWRVTRLNWAILSFKLGVNIWSAVKRNSWRLAARRRAVRLIAISALLRRKFILSCARQASISHEFTKVSWEISNLVHSTGNDNIPTTRWQSTCLLFIRHKGNIHKWQYKFTINAILYTATRAKVKVGEE